MEATKFSANRLARALLILLVVAKLAVGGAASTRVRVVTYNVLCSHVCSPTFFTRTEPRHLEARTRLGKVLRTLEGEVAQGAVIGLQEISLEWAGEMHTFFAARGYHLVISQYGNGFNNYMGVGLAWPVERYRAKAVAIERISDTRRWPKQAPPPGLVARLRALPRALLRAPAALRGRLTSAAGKRKATSFGGGHAGDPLEVARSRHNRAVAAVLEPVGDAAADGSFVVGCYHMPCLFRNLPDRQVMLIHASLYAQWVQRLAARAGQLPYVALGDWNSIPGSPVHALLTTPADELAAALPREHPERPPARAPHDTTTWEPELTGGALRSAYAVANGDEPSFTCNAWTADGPGFRGTLDYIFVSDEWEVDGVRALPTIDAVGEDAFYPDEAEPSDHLMLAADLALAAR
jgi:endonuclease/exonuclease/phosphatase family metal-dependent hydrolase